MEQRMLPRSGVWVGKPVLVARAYHITPRAPDARAWLVGAQE